jgi:hypothetical protein
MLPYEAFCPPWSRKFEARYYPLIIPRIHRSYTNSGHGIEAFFVSCELMYNPYVETQYSWSDEGKSVRVSFFEVPKMCRSDPYLNRCRSGVKAALISTSVARGVPVGGLRR